ncbi:MAG: hypothetical protein JSW42_09015 [Chloroflexota bacterium]|nr:MAG: hypothetical protein JSW42_09015 [Chloroflexota bacterium]
MRQIGANGEEREGGCGAVEEVFGEGDESGGQECAQEVGMGGRGLGSEPLGRYQEIRDDKLM